MTADVPAETLYDWGIMVVFSHPKKGVSAVCLSIFKYIYCLSKPEGVPRPFTIASKHFLVPER